MQARPWATLAPENCSWQHFDDLSMRITLAKARSSLGSWPHSLQSLALADVSSKEAPFLHHTCLHDKAAFNATADHILETHLAEAQALRTAFAQAISEQVSSVPSGPLGQTAFLFPQQGLHCLNFIRTCTHLPAVRKLVRIARDLTGVALLDDPQFEFPPATSLFSLVSCLVAGLAGVEQHRAGNGIESIKKISSCVGLGAGECAAAVFSGALRLDDAFAVLRAQAAVDAKRASLADEDETYYARSVVAVRAAIETVHFRPPRVRVYCGADGTACDNAEEVARALLCGVCAAPVDEERKQELKRALVQQGVAELTVLVPEIDEQQDAADDDEKDEEELPGGREVNETSPDEKTELLESIDE